MKDGPCEKCHALEVVQRTAFLDKEPADCRRLVPIVYVMFGCIVYLFDPILLVVCWLIVMVLEFVELEV